MRYVLRDAAGKIVSLHLEPVPGAEPLPVDHPEVKAFVAIAEDDERSFAGMDANLVRVLEDLIDVLIERNVLRITDLPAEAQQKLFDRKHFRSRVQKKSLQLFGADFGAASSTSQGVLPDVSGLLPPDDAVPKL